ncbi:MAG: helix-turn-helix domain-containing protein [Vulcanimicrobiota bacterium]
MILITNMFNSEKLSKWLSENEITQYRFARMTGLDQSTISRIISGAIDPGSRTVARICQSTGLSPDDLIIVALREQEEVMQQ